jgi:hypothetical protein
MEETSIAFTNTYTPIKEHFIQSFRCRIFGRNGLHAKIMGGILAALFLMLVGVNLLAEGKPFSQKNGEIMLLIAGVGIVLAGAYVLMPERVANAVIRNLRRPDGSIPTFTLKFRRSGISFTDPVKKDEESLFLYKDFTACVESRDLFVLRYKNGQMMLVVKDALDPGDVDAFRNYISEVCPGAKKSFQKA